jgi:hypothetical protein
LPGSDWQALPWASLRSRMSPARQKAFWVVFSLSGLASKNLLCAY